MKILTIIDSFKGTLSSKTMGSMIENHFKQHDVDYFEVSDGGEGFLTSVMQFCEKGHVESFIINNSLFTKINSQVFYHNKTAYIESAKAIGLAGLFGSDKNPSKTSSFGVGEMIKLAVLMGHKQIVIGIGGTSTNDGGTGMLEALGVKFYDKDNKRLEFMNGSKLIDIARIDDYDLVNLLKDVNFTVICDVNNPLLGENGATYIYSPQKGASPEMVATLEEGMKNYHQIVCKTKKDYNFTPGSGAAGGIGYAIHSFFNAQFVSGVDYILDRINFKEEGKKYDLIITGEGKIDYQTLCGKVVNGICKQAKELSKDVIAVCGINEISALEQQELGIKKIYSVVPTYATKEESLQEPKKYFELMINDIEI